MKSVMMFTTVLAAASTVFAQPSIESDRNNIIVTVPNGGQFKLGDESIAITKDVTDAISSVNTDISKVTSDLADGLAAAATKVSVEALGNVYSTKEDVQQAIATVTQSVTDLQSMVAMQTDLTSLNQTLNDAIGEQSEISDGILDAVNYLNGWKGVIPFDKCTVQNCSVAIHGRGFFPSDSYFNGTMIDLKGNYKYVVKVSPATQSKSFECSVLSVVPNFIFANCGSIMADPPSQQFWTSVTVTEDGVPIPYTGDKSESKALQFTTTKPTISTFLKSYSFTTGNHADLKTSPIAVNFSSHGDTTPTFKSSDESTVSVFKYDESKGTFTAQFKKNGIVTVTIGVTDSIGQTGSLQIKVEMEDAYVCNANQIRVLKADSCKQDPKDPHWGRNSEDCMKIQDGSKAWNPKSGTHIAKYKQGGSATLLWDEKTVYSVTIWQNADRSPNTEFDIFTRDVEETWTKVASCYKAEGCAINKSNNGLFSFETDESKRRITGLRMVRTGADRAFETYRVTEIVINGCD